MEAEAKSKVIVDCTVIEEQNRVQVMNSRSRKRANPRLNCWQDSGDVFHWSCRCLILSWSRCDLRSLELNGNSNFACDFSEGYKWALLVELETVFLDYIVDLTSSCLKLLHSDVYVIKMQLRTLSLILSKALFLIVKKSRYGNTTFNFQVRSILFWFNTKTSNERTIYDNFGQHRLNRERETK